MRVKQSKEWSERQDDGKRVSRTSQAASGCHCHEDDREAIESLDQDERVKVITTRVSRPRTTFDRFKMTDQTLTHHTGSPRRSLRRILVLKLKTARTLWIYVANILGFGGFVLGYLAVRVDAGVWTI